MIDFPPPSLVTLGGRRLAYDDRGGGAATVPLFSMLGFVAA